MDRVPKWGGAAKAAPSSFIVENGKWKVESWGGGAARSGRRGRRPLRRAGECGGCRAAAHMGAALRRNYKLCVGAAAPPDDGHRIFINCHSEERSDVGIRFLLCGSAARGEYGLPRAFHALAMTGLGGAVRVGGGVRAPRPTEKLIKCA